MPENRVANGGALVGAVSGLGLGWYAYRTGIAAEGPFNMKPLRMKTTYLLYATTIAGYFVGKTVFGALAPVKK